MHNLVKAMAGMALCALLSGCGGDKTTGQACLGANNDTLVEKMPDQCKAGDAIATKHPAYFCDFNYAVAYNDYNSAFCIYAGALKAERIKGKS
ncbi:hypothetical protein [Aeromonas bivalvium]|uniref:hypothetical protein n=1 Tax=Aeromonas bivalvium TaxID=440079 RepID=UPI0005A732C9|nr:hypothetical protein [Aeromonas bivalvium]